MEKPISVRKRLREEQEKLDAIARKEQQEAIEAQRYEEELKLQEQN